MTRLRRALLYDCQISQSVEFLIIRNPTGTILICVQTTPQKQRDLRKEFNTFVDGKDEQLESLLMAPLQRAPQYLVLLVNLLGLTDTAHPDYQQLKEVQKHKNAPVT